MFNSPAPVIVGRLLIVNGPAGTACSATRTLLMRMSAVLGTEARPETAISG